MIDRLISQEIKQTKKSILLLGPRQVGKSTLIKTFKPDLTINLMNELEFLNHSSKPEEIAKLIKLNKAKTIFVDEVQKIPSILNTIQSLIDDNKNLKFYLTGSSARKLKRGGANLLPGRVLNYKLGPLTAKELDYKIDTNKILAIGSLPEIYLSDSLKNAQKLITTYAANYLTEEIKAEALTRSLEAFARFLTEATLSAAQFVDFTKLSKKAKISRHSIPRYFEILEDTLVGYRIFPFDPLKESCDLVRHPKFYLFDNGVYNSLLNNFVPSLDRIGTLSEQLIFDQILHSSWANDELVEISSFRTRKGDEVDFILKKENQIFAIEVKSNDNVNTDDLNGLEFFSSVYPKVKGSFIFHTGQIEKKFGKYWSLPWQKGLQELGL